MTSQELISKFLSYFYYTDKNIIIYIIGEEKDKLLNHLRNINYFDKIKLYEEELDDINLLQYISGCGKIILCPEFGNLTSNYIFNLLKKYCYVLNVKEFKSFTLKKINNIPEQTEFMKLDKLKLLGNNSINRFIDDNYKECPNSIINLSEFIIKYIDYCKKENRIIHYKFNEINYNLIKKIRLRGGVIKKKKIKNNCIPIIEGLMLKSQYLNQMDIFN